MFSAKPDSSRPFFQCQGDLFYSSYDRKQSENKGPFQRLDTSPIPCEKVVSKLTELCREERAYSGFYNVSLRETAEDGVSDSRGINSRDLCRSTLNKFSCAVKLSKGKEYADPSQVFEKCWGLKGDPYQEPKPKK